MNENDLMLKDPNTVPTREMVEEFLGDSYSAYETFQDELTELEIEQEWQWYAQYKAWFAKGQYFWITSKGTKKEKNLYWLYIYKGYFCIAVWFKEKNRAELANINVSKETKEIIHDAKTMGKLPTFPVVINIKTIKQLEDIYTLIKCKKRLEL